MKPNTNRARPKSITDNVAELAALANAADILRVFNAGKPDDVATYAYELEASVQWIEKTLTRAADPAHRVWAEMLLAERLRLYYAARETDPRFAVELLAEIEGQVFDMPAPPDLGRIRAAAEASDLIESAVRVLKPRDKRLFNALPAQFARVEVKAVAERLGYPPATAYRRAVPRLHALGLLARTDDGWAKTVTALPA